MTDSDFRFHLRNALAASAILYAVGLTAIFAALPFVPIEANPLGAGAHVFMTASVLFVIVGLAGNVALCVILADK